MATSGYKSDKVMIKERQIQATLFILPFGITIEIIDITKTKQIKEIKNSFINNRLL